MSHNSMLLPQDETIYNTVFDRYSSDFPSDFSHNVTLIWKMSNRFCHLIAQLRISHISNIKGWLKARPRRPGQ